MYRKSTYLFIVNMINRSLNFILRIVLRAVLGLTGYGTIAVILPIQNLILTLTSYAVSPSVSKFVSEDETDGQLKDLYPFYFIFIGLLIFVVGYAISPLFASFLSEEFSDSIIGPLRTMFLVVPFGVLFSIFTGIYFGKQRARIVAYALFIVQTSTVVLAYILGYINSVEGAVLAFLISYLLGTLFLSVPMISRISKWGLDSQRGKEMLVFSLPILITSLSIVIIFQVDILILGRYYTTLETALYGLVTPTARLIPAFSIALSTMLLPRLSSLKASKALEEADDTLNKAFDMGFVISLPFALAIFAFSKEILYVLFNSVEATDSLRVLSIGMFFYSLYYLFSSSLQGLGKPHIPMYTLLTCAIVDIALCFALIPDHALIGAASATSISMFLAFLILFLYIRPHKIPRIYNFLTILPLLAFERYVGIFGNRIETVLVYGAVSVIYVLIYIKYNDILEVLKNG